MRSELLLTAAITLTLLVTSAPTGAQSTTLPALLQGPGPVNARWALDEVMPDINIDTVPLNKVVDYLRTISGANLVVDWKRLEDAGVAKDAPITLQVRDLTLRKLLQLALNQASPNTTLQVGVDQNVIEVTTQDAADQVLVTKTYSIADLLVPEITEQAPRLDLNQAVQQGGQGGGGGGSNLFGGSSGGDTPSGTGNRTPQQIGDDLAAIIRTIVRPNIWVENGGNSSIKFFMGQLIVTAPQSVQEAIGGSAESGGGRYGY